MLTTNNFVERKKLNCELVYVKSENYVWTPINSSSKSCDNNDQDKTLDKSIITLC